MRATKIYKRNKIWNQEKSEQDFNGKESNKD